MLTKREGKRKNGSAYLRLPFSLNDGKRRKELLRVSRDNATLAKRITELKPENTRDVWKSAWSRNAAYMDNISKTNAEWHVSKVGVEDFCSF